MKAKVLFFLLLVASITTSCNKEQGPIVLTGAWNLDANYVYNVIRYDPSIGVANPTAVQFLIDHEDDLTEPLKFMKRITFEENGNVTFTYQDNSTETGTYELDGTYFTIESEIYPDGLAGAEIDRGSGLKYVFYFDESSNSFRIGTTGNTQPVATREDSPINNGIAVWDNSLYRFKSTLNLSANTISATTLYGNGSNLTNINLAHSATTGILGNGQYHLSQSEYTQISGSVLNNTYVSLSGDVMNGQLTVPSISATTITGTTLYGNGSNLTGINDYYVTGGTLNSGLLTLNRQNGSLTIPGFLGGTGTTNYITKWNSTTGLTNSSIFDNGNIGINTLNPTQLLDVNGGIKGNNITISGNTILNSVTGNTFYGNGSGLTNINLAHSATTGILGNGQYHLSDTEYAQISGSVLNNTYVSLSGDVMSGDLRLNNIIVNSLSGTAINDIKVSSNGKIILSDDKQTINNITGSTILDNFPSLTGDACVWDYVLKSNTGMRAGTITGVWSGSTVDFYETSTNDIGSTSSVNLSVDYLNSNIRLLINVVSGTWLVKIKRTIL
jgi:hypothetical protein